MTFSDKMQNFFKDSYSSALKWCAIVSAYLRIELSVPARPSVATNDERREDVRGGRLDGG